MKLPDWKEFQETMTDWAEMDPVYEAILAQALSNWPEEQDIVDITPTMVFEVEETTLTLVPEAA